MKLAELVVAVDPSDRPAWLEWRRGGIGASDIAALLGISPWGSPWSVWADKVGLLPEEHQSDVMEAGRWLELAIGPWFGARTGLHVDTRQLACQHPDGLARCTLDGIVADGPTIPELIEELLGGLEIKTEGFGKKWVEIPAHHQAQGQWQMAVTGLERVWFPVLMGRRLDIHELARDEGDIKFMLDRAEQFWADHVATGSPPATDGHDATLRALAAVYPQPLPDSSVDLDDLVTVLGEWRQAKVDKKAAELAEKTAAAAIQAALGTAEEGAVAGQRAVSWRRQTRKSYVVAEATFRVLRDHTPKEKAS